MELHYGLVQVGLSNTSGCYHNPCTSPQEEGVADPSSTTYMQRWAAGGKDSSRLTSRDELYKHATLLKIEISWIHGTRTLLALPK
ncbi:hypothetical protein XENTR_v10006573 [Xenopus tropicalis]|nr:hypothetical protein XENTR_v10006573 [Xenopus tropicalis]